MWQQCRREMIAETERFIEWGLRHPESVDWIPARPVRTGGFPRVVSVWFFREVFFAANAAAGSWRQRLRRLRVGLFGKTAAPAGQGGAGSAGVEKAQP
jgi:hypothetical protein